MSHSFFNPIMKTGQLSRDNYFDELRLFLAVAVFLDHAWQIVNGQNETEIFRLFDLTSGYIAVNGFFFLSGYLIYMSLARRGVSVGYVASRGLRIMPALIALGLLASLVVAPVVTGQMGAAAYWSDPQTWRYPFEVMTFGDVSGGPPGWATNSPMPGEFSPPLWTLKFEVICYILAPICVLLGLWRSRTLLWLSIVAMAIAVIVVEPANPVFAMNDFLKVMLRFFFVFSFGAGMASISEEWTPTLMSVAIGVAMCIASGLTGIGEEFSVNVALCFALLYIGRLPRAPRTGWHMPDISYGLYIWHYPVMQIVYMNWTGANEWQILFTAILFVVPMAFASWYLVEKPALKLKPYFTEAFVTGLLPTKLRQFLVR